jgi:hypothetical protein
LEILSVIPVEFRPGTKQVFNTLVLENEMLEKAQTRSRILAMIGLMILSMAIAMLTVMAITAFIG